MAVILNVAYTIIFKKFDLGLMTLFYTTLGFTVLTLTIGFMRRIFAYLAHIISFIMASLCVASLGFLVLKACDVEKTYFYYIA